MAFDHYLPRLESTAVVPSDANKTDAFDWSPDTDPTADDTGAYSSRRAPRAQRSVTLWDEVAPEAPRAFRDGVEPADDTSAV